MLKILTNKLWEFKQLTKGALVAGLTGAAIGGVSALAMHKAEAKKIADLNKKSELTKLFNSKV